MTSFGPNKRLGLVTSASIAAAMLMVLLAPAVAAAAPGPSAAHPASVAPAAGSPYSWAFGRTYSYSYSCPSGSTPCPGASNLTNATQSLSLSISVKWVVIYTETNISASQTELTAKTALGVSLSLSESVCVTTSPCAEETASASLSGQQTFAGATNVTTGLVDLTTGPGSPASVAALAVMNAASHRAFNVSGSFSLNEAAIGGSTISASFDVGGSETAQIAFASPLGLVPANPSVGDAWTASEPFTASGKYVSGISLSATLNGTSRSASVWTPGSVAKSGTLWANGTDNASASITDNATTPPKTITVQEIYLNFSGGNFTASDGFLFWSNAMTADLFGGLDVPAGGAGPAVGTAVVPALSLGTDTAESVDFEPGFGFVGEQLAENGTKVTAGIVPGAPSLALSASPESVSDANAQYSAITASSSSPGTPLWVWAAVAVVVIAVVVGVALVLRSRRRAKPSSMGSPPAATMMTPSMPPAPPTPPAPGSP